MIKRSVSILFIFLCFKLQTLAQPVIYSIQAHQDDWQLFMSSKIITDLYAGSKVVFITLTAGDGGCGNCTYTPNRETGSVYSAKFAADLTTGTTPTDVPSATTVTINSHIIKKYVYKNTVNYFLMLPDGGQSGNGFPSTGNRSLQRFRANLFTNMAAVDGSATYSNWSNLVSTIRAIINAEKITGRQGWIHSASLDTTSSNINTYNKFDHSDHYYTAKAAQEAVPSSTMGWVGINYFVDYYSYQLSHNLNSDAYQNATIIVGLCALGITLAEYRNEFTIDHQQWLPMDYFAWFRQPNGNAP